MSARSRLRLGEQISTNFICWIGACYSITLVDKLEQGTIDRDKMYTASLAVPQSVIFNPEQHQELLALLDQLSPLIKSGRAVYVTYSQAVDIWRTYYGAQPNIFYHNSTTPSNAKLKDGHP